MCLYPKLVKNPKYKANKKNGGIVPVLDDKRKEWVPVGCQKCIECKKQKASQWRIRLIEDIKINNKGIFVTLTFSDENLIELENDVKKVKDIEGYELDNQVAKLAVKRFRERWRKKYKRSIRHWLVTELGGRSTERIHLHGFLWAEDKEEIQKKWKYGRIDFGYTKLNEKTINYCVKYLHKNDIKHKGYNSIILTSSGIGKNYIENKTRIEEQREKKKDYYITKEGYKMKLPIYYRNHIFDEKAREKMWIENIEKKERYVLGVKIDISNRKGEEKYYKVLKEAQRKNEMWGYGNGSIDWDKRIYENERRNIKRKERLKKYKK